MVTSATNKATTMRKTKLALGIVVASAILSGCNTSPVYPVPYKDNKVDENYEYLKGMPVGQNQTPYSASLSCIAEHKSEMLSNSLRGQFTLTVGEVKDLTGKYDYDEGGFKVTQGAANMVMSAILKAGVFRVVDRNHMEISDMERILAVNKLLREYKDGEPKVRSVTAGEVVGSDYKIVGSITELNYNIDSGGYEADIAGWSSKARRYVSDVGIDLFLVDTKSTEVISYVSVKKQIVGYETRNGVFRFFGNDLFDIGLGEKKQEPIHLAVRSAIEDAVYKFTQDLYGIPNTSCAKLKYVADGLIQQTKPNQ